MFAYCVNNPVTMSDSSGYLGAEGALAATNWWNPFGWIMAAVVLVEVVIIVAAVVDQVSDSDTETIYGDKTNSAGNSQSVEGPAAAAPAAPPPNGNDRNNNRQRNGTPKNNQAQNRQVDDISNKVGLSKYQRRMLHDEISGQDYSYQEILEIAYEIKGLYLK